MNSLSTNHQNLFSKSENPGRHLSPVQVRLALSPRFTTTSPSSPSSSTPTSNANRRIAIAVDMSDESGYAVKWAIQNYLRPGDAVILLHVRPTSVLYGADWGSNTPNNNNNNNNNRGEEEEEEVMEEDFDKLTNKKAVKLSEPLTEALIPFKIHIVKDHDLKERLCLEVERLGLSAVIMGSRGFGASDKRKSKRKLGSVSDYCVRHSVCPVVVVRYPDDQGINNDHGQLHPVTEEDQEYYDAEGQIQNAFSEWKFSKDEQGEEIEI